MATQRQWRRGTTAQHASYTGAVAEVTVNTDNDRLHVHDGATAAGFPVPNFVDIQNSAMVAANATGTDALAVTLAPAPGAYAAYQVVHFKAANNNTGAATINVNGLGAKNLKKNGGAQSLEADDIVAGGIYTAMYDGTEFQLLGSVGSSGGLRMLEAATPSAASSVDFPALLTTNYRYYKLLGHLVPSTGLNLNLRVSTDGSTFQSGGSAYRYSGRARVDNSDTVTIARSTGAAQIVMTPVGLEVDGGASACGFEITLFNPPDSSHFMPVRWELSYQRGGSVAHDSRGTGHYVGGAGAVQGVQILPSTGTVTGFVNLYGVQT